METQHQIQVVKAVPLAVRHALGWLVFGNAAGLYLALLLLEPRLQAGALSYGRWVPVHLNVQLYGWTSLPLIAWLLSVYQADEARHAGWGSAAVWAWTASLAMGVVHWLGGITSGKLFLDWKDAALWSFVLAQVVLWVALAVAWFERRNHWSRMRRLGSLIGLAGLALVPPAMVFASSPEVYPPIDRTTGGPTGSSLLGSALFVVGLMLLLPRVVADQPRKHRSHGLWAFVAASWVVFVVTETIGGTHRDFWQIGSMLILLPWAWLLPADWRRFELPAGIDPWKRSMFLWWGVLVATGVLMYQDGVLDRIKFTQALVAHSHLAMAGFTTSFCALICSLLTHRNVGNRLSVALWNIGSLLMILTLAASGWMEGANPHWMTEPPAWRVTGFVIRALCGAVMLGASVHWFIKHRKS